MSIIKYREKFNKNYFEQIAWQHNKLVCGIDEVGRGCLAGPVVAAAVMLEQNITHRMLKDSKFMTQAELIRTYSWLQNKCIYATALVHSRDIDLYNIYYATLHAMRKCVLQLFNKVYQLPEKIIIDAMPLNLQDTIYQHIDVYCFNSGEKKSSSIAAASIIAKVTRDTIMHNLDTCFPYYALSKHKGYATKEHQQAINLHGKSIIHRSSFVDGKSWAEQENNLLIDFKQQRSLLL